MLWKVFIADSANPTRADYAWSPASKTPVEAVDSNEAAKLCAESLPSANERTFYCIPMDAITKVTLFRNVSYETFEKKRNS